MVLLAPKLPYSHAFAGGYPRRGGQPLPSDPEAIDYLERVAAADGGVAVEVGVAMAVDTLVKGCKADGIWDAIKASCLLCGPRTLSGALTSLKSYGDELVDIESLPTPAVTISPSVGLATAWDGTTRTLSVTSAGSSADRPVAVFPVGMVSGRMYRIEGRLSGDTARAFNIGAGSGQWTSYNTSTGKFSGTVLASGTYFWMYVDGRQTSSITIESLSIKEYFANPTNVGNSFVSGDYNRVTGLKGDGATTYLDSGRAGNADGLNDRHFAIYKTSTTLATEWHGGVYDTTAPNHITGIRGASDGTELLYASSLATEGVTVASPSSSTAGLRGTARSSPTNVNYFTPTDSGALSINSSREEERNYFMFALNLDGSAYQHSASRLAFYSIGSALDLALLDTHVSRYVSAVQFWHNTGLAATGYDDATVDYINRAYANGGRL